eukprot:Nk52_evm6s325 gene=Nk52_evmTU6s325
MKTKQPSGGDTTYPTVTGFTLTENGECTTQEGTEGVTDFVKVCVTKNNQKELMSKADYENVCGSLSDISSFSLSALVQILNLKCVVAKKDEESKKAQQKNVEMATKQSDEVIEKTQDIVKNAGEGVANMVEGQDSLTTGLLNTLSSTAQDLNIGGDASRSCQYDFSTNQPKSFFSKLYCYFFLPFPWSYEAASADPDVYWGQKISAERLEKEGIITAGDKKPANGADLKVYIEKWIASERKYLYYGAAILIASLGLMYFFTKPPVQNEDIAAKLAQAEKEAAGTLKSNLSEA